MDTDLNLGFMQVFWLLGIPLLWLVYFRYRSVSFVWPRWLPAISIRYPVLNSLHLSPVNVPVSKPPQQPALLMTLAFSFFLLALSQPVQYTGYIEKQQLKQPLDMIFAVDTALSMSLTDYLVNNQPVSRIDMVKKSLVDFISQYSGTHLALVVLGNPPALWLPLTSDFQVVQHEVTRLTTFLGGRITDMGATLKLIEAQFSVNKHARDKIVILFSDGGTQVGSVSPQEAAAELADKGFVVYVMAVGAAVQEGKVLDTSSLLYEPVNISMLREVAQKGKGRLFHISDPRSFVQAMAEIQKSHGQSDSQSAYISEKNKLSRPLFALPLGLALVILLFLAVNSSTRKSHVS